MSSKSEPTSMKDSNDIRELFRLASLIGCEPEDEERHRQQLLDYVTSHQTALIDTVIGELPENKSHMKYDRSSYTDLTDEGYNQALKEVTDILLRVKGDEE